MPRTFAAFVPPLLAALALLVMGKVVAGPPERVSGRMMLDDVAEALRRCRSEPDEDRRLELLFRAAQSRSRDPRVAVALGEFIEGATDELNQGYVARLVLRLYGGRSKFITSGRDPFVREARDWWKENQADLRRRAIRLPR